MVLICVICVIRMPFFCLRLPDTLSDRRGGDGAIITPMALILTHEKTDFDAVASQCWAHASSIRRPSPSCRTT
jgi:hypothetical protein